MIPIIVFGLLALCRLASLTGNGITKRHGLDLEAVMAMITAIAMTITMATARLPHSEVQSALYPSQSRGLGLHMVAVYERLTSKALVQEMVCYIQLES